jgi:hypothetical protein
VSLGDRGIATSKQEKTMAAGAQMWQSEMFAEDQMVVWENKLQRIKRGRHSKPTSWKSAGTKAVFDHYGKTIEIQRGGTPSPRGGSSQGERRDAGDAICNAAGTAHKADCTNGGNEYDQYGGNDGKNERNDQIERKPVDEPS